MKKKLGRQWVSTSINQLGVGTKSSQEILDKIKKTMPEGTSAEHEIYVRLGLKDKGDNMTDEQCQHILDKFDRLIEVGQLIEEQLTCICSEIAYIGTVLHQQTKPEEDEV